MYAVFMCKNHELLAKVYYAYRMFKHQCLLKTKISINRETWNYLRKKNISIFFSEIMCKLLSSMLDNYLKIGKLTCVFFR